MFVESVLYRMSKHINIDNEIRLFKDNIESLRVTNIFKNRRINITTALIYYTIVNVNIRMYNFDDVQCTVIPSVAYGFVTGMNLQLC